MPFLDGDFQPNQSRWTMFLLGKLWRPLAMSVPLRSAYRESIAPRGSMSRIIVPC